MARLPTTLSARARLALRSLAHYEAVHHLTHDDALILAARDAQVSEWYLRYSLLKTPHGADAYAEELARIRASSTLQTTLDQEVPISA